MRSRWVRSFCCSLACDHRRTGRESEGKTGMGEVIRQASGPRHLCVKVGKVTQVDPMWSFLEGPDSSACLPMVWV